MSKNSVIGSCKGAYWWSPKADSRGRTIDWLIFNAGVAEVISLDWITIIEQFLKDPIILFTLPRYLIERVGSKTEDGLGLVFQANVFGHYYMVISVPFCS